MLADRSEICKQCVFIFILTVEMKIKIKYNHFNKENEGAILWMVALAGR